MDALPETDPLKNIEEAKKIMEDLLELVKANIDKLLYLYLTFLAGDVSLLIIHSKTSSFLHYKFDINENINLITLVFVLNSAASILGCLGLKGMLLPEKMNEMMEQIKVFMIFQIVLFATGCSSSITMATYSYQYLNPVFWQAVLSVKSFQLAAFNGGLAYVATRPEFKTLMEKYKEAQLKIDDLKSKVEQ